MTLSVLDGPQADVACTFGTLSIGGSATTTVNFTVAVDKKRA